MLSFIDLRHRNKIEDIDVPITSTGLGYVESLKSAHKLTNHVHTYVSKVKSYREVNLLECTLNKGTTFTEIVILRQKMTEIRVWCSFDK